MFLLPKFLGCDIYLDFLEKKGGDDSFHFAFKTVDYEYSTTNLDEEGTSQLFKVVADFLESCYQESKDQIELINISPANASYSREEVEDCIVKILEGTDRYTREELLDRYKGFRIFDLYEEIFEKPFSEVHYNSVSRASGRLRYFQIQFKKYLKNWEIDNHYQILTSFVLKRKKHSI